MSEKSNSRQQIITYLVLVFAFSSVFYLLTLRAHSLGAGTGLYVFGIMWCPALAGMATLKIYKRDLRDLGWKWPEKKYAIQSWFIPLLYASVAYGIVWCFRLGGFPNHEFMDAIAARMGLRASPVVSPSFTFYWQAVSVWQRAWPHRLAKRSVGAAFWFQNSSRISALLLRL
jgi:preprotein translocase subunit SecE